MDLDKLKADLKELNNAQLELIVEVSLNRLSGDDRQFILRLIEKMRKVDIGREEGNH
jgi:hypothetical protein